MIDPLWSYALVSIGVFGMYLSGKKNYWGWAVGVGVQFLWLAYGLTTGQHGFLWGAVLYGSIQGRNL